ncbi:MAG: 4-hydroxy-3-methylbut-2-enyl diphosphate reductase [Deltaproteobacteria bacterium]|nr:4-hydroxy-3-methylbut-2-enyl diphosphate reductase [Deltaproteobacteria bacterium]
MTEVLVAGPRGFCAGVERAIEIVEMALNLYGPPVYVRKEIVHNRHVVEELRAKGAIFVEAVDEVPEGSLVIFSAHGVAPVVHEETRARRLRVIDATCPLVTKVHLEVHRFMKAGYSIILVGHKDHDEVIGTMGEAPGKIQLVTSVEDAEAVQVPNPDKVMVLTQTTLSVDDTREIVATLRRRFPRLATPPKDDICYATQNRQAAVKELARQADLILVIGSANSSNANRLVEVAQVAGTRAHLIDDVRDISPAWLNGVRAVGVTAAASTPEVLVQQVVEYLREHGARDVREVATVKEDVRFGLPSFADAASPAS